MRILLLTCGFFVFGVGRGLAQAPTTAKPKASIEAFLREVSAAAAAAGPVILNGEPTTLVRPDPKEVLGLDDASWTRLRTIADDLRDSEQAITAAEKPVVLELRMALAGGEEVSELRQRVAALEERRQRVTAEHVESFRRDLASRLAEIEAYISSRADNGSFFPGPSGVPTPVSGKTR